MIRISFGREVPVQNHERLIDVSVLLPRKHADPGVEVDLTVKDQHLGMDPQLEKAVNIIVEQRDS